MAYFTTEVEKMVLHNNKICPGLYSCLAMMTSKVRVLFPGLQRIRYRNLSEERYGVKRCWFKRRGNKNICNSLRSLSENSWIIVGMRI